ncbi:hypothetical protein [Persicobacter psychrovividus]|uniref:Uncharacterized protein n=1 Tax=Persicobacter psychrovividus TaxID=387638 RepID=A0ABN6L8K5_9BACT|nr:hypothetical protein PEPS_17440 [Persicobacter psychrovividus]
MIVFQTNYVRIIHNTELKCLEMLWKQAFNETEYQTALGIGLNYLSDKKLNRWVSDYRLLDDVPDDALTELKRVQISKFTQLPYLDVIMITGTRPMMIDYCEKIHDILDRKLPNANVRIEINEANKKSWFNNSLSASRQF